MLSLRRYIANFVLSFLPPTRLFGLKAFVWNMAGVKVRHGARLVSSVKIWTSGPVTIGEGTFVGHEVMIAGGNAPVVIGQNCDIAPRVLIVTGSHKPGDGSRAAGKSFSQPITIGDGVWIGASTTILGNVEVGSGTMIGAGSLVNKSIPTQKVALGIPCKVLRSRVINEQTRVLG